MQIDSSILSGFFKKISLDTKIATAKLIGVVDGTSTSLALMDNINVKGWLSEKVFHKFEQVELEIRDTGKFNRLLKSFKGKISINIENNFVKMYNDNKTAFFKRASQINNWTNDVPKIQYDSGIDIPSSFIDEVLNNISTTDAKSVLFEVKDNILVVTAEGDEDNVKEQVIVQYKNAKFRISAEYFRAIFNSLENDKINISFQDLEIYERNPPLKITDKGETYKVEAWVAPFNPE